MEIRQVSKSQSAVHGSSDPNDHQNIIADQEDKTLGLKSSQNSASLFIILTANQPFNMTLYIHLRPSLLFFCFSRKREILTQSMTETSVPAPNLVETLAAILP